MRIIVHVLLRLHDRARRFYRYDTFSILCFNPAMLLCIFKTQSLQHGIKSPVWCCAVLLIVLRLRLSSRLLDMAYD